jgi:hypothetical protein
MAGTALELLLKPTQQVRKHDHGIGGDPRFSTGVG